MVFGRNFDEGRKVPLIDALMRILYEAEDTIQQPEQTAPNNAKSTICPQTNLATTYSNMTQCGQNQGNLASYNCVTAAETVLSQYV